MRTADSESISMSTAPSNADDKVESHYKGRAADYDERDGGWHIQLGKDFVEWLSPIQSDSVALDLACGTGLVTIPLASAIGSSGKVIGVDLTKSMLDQARSKQVSLDAAPIEWIEGDIMDLSAVSEVRRIVRERGGFDVVSCCSALVLLPSPSAAIRSWSQLLKPGGKMIIDVPTDDRTVQYLITVDMKHMLDVPSDLDRSWIQGAQSLRHLFEEAGLNVEQSHRTRNYVEDLESKVYDGSEGERVWEQQLEKLRDLVHLKEERKEEAKAEFLELWEKHLGEEGKFRDGVWLYVVLGRK